MYAGLADQIKVLPMPHRRLRSASNGSLHASVQTTERYIGSKQKQSAVAFENPDFVEVVIHCYRSVFGLEAGDPALQPLEDHLAQKPTVKVPTVTIDGATDPLKPGGTAEHARMFVGLHEHRVVDAGHNLPQQAPQPFADAVFKVRDWFLLERHTDDWV